MRIRSRSARVAQTFSLATALAVTAWVVNETMLAQTVPQPVLMIVPTNGNQVLLTISNAVASTNYEIYRTPLLNDTNFPFILHLVGSVGQSNFVADMGVESLAFFRASIGTDLDGDGVQDWLDAAPLDPTIGILSITIDSPTNGASIQ
jgi:hypothetical protein